MRETITIREQMPAQEQHNNTQRSSECNKMRLTTPNYCMEIIFLCVVCFYVQSNGVQSYSLLFVVILFCFFSFCLAPTSYHHVSVALFFALFDVVFGSLICFVFFSFLHSSFYIFLAIWLFCFRDMVSCVFLRNKAKQQGFCSQNLSSGMNFGWFRGYGFFLYAVLRGYI